MSERTYPIPRFAPIVLGASVLLGLLRGLLYLVSFDAGVGYFNGGVLRWIFIVLSVAAFAGMIAIPCYAYCLQRKGTAVLCPLPAPSPTLWQEKVPQILTGVILLALFVSRVSVFRNGGSATMEQPALIFALLSAPFFLFGPKKQTVLSGLLFIFFLTAVLVMEYRDWNVAINSPIKIWSQLSYICMMSYQLVELRLYSRTSHPQFYAPYAGLAVLFCISDGISLFLPLLVRTLQGKDFSALPEGYALRVLLVFCFGIFAAVRLFAAKPRAVVFNSPWKEEKSKNKKGDRDSAAQEPASADNGAENVKEEEKTDDGE